MSKGAYTTDVSRGNVAKDHDERVFTSLNVDQRLSERNVVVIESEGTYKTLVNDFFHAATVEYNEKQERYRHRDRMITDDDYYTALSEGKTGFGSLHKERNKDGKLINVDSQEKPVYEYVVGIGNRDNLGVTDAEFDYFKWRDLRRQGRQDEADAMVDAHLNTDDPAREDMKEVLVELAQELSSRYPRFKFWTAIVHDDEPGASCHLHLAFTPWTEGGKNGMSKRVSLTRALNSMGFKNSKEGLAIEQWQKDINSVLEDKMRERGYERTTKSPDQGKGPKHEETSAFVTRNEAEYWSEKKEELQAECFSLDEQVATLEMKVKNTAKQASSGATIEELDRREADLQKQSNEQNALAAKQAALQAALNEQDKAYRKTIDDHELKVKAYKNRYGQLFAGIQGLSGQIPEPGPSMIENLIQGVQAMDSMDRYGITQYEKEITASDTAYAAAKKRLDLAVADSKAATRGKQTGKAKAIRDSVIKKANNDEYQKEF